MQHIEMLIPSSLYSKFPHTIDPDCKWLCEIKFYANFNAEKE